MPNEQKVTVRYEVDNGEFKYKTQYGTEQYNQATGTGGTPGIVAATTTAASVSFTPVVPGYVFVKNLSTGDSVQFQTTGGNVFAEMTPKKIGIISRTTSCVTWQVKASTASGTPNVEIRGFST